jgi:hypothetical protein
MRPTPFLASSGHSALAVAKAASRWTARTERQDSSVSSSMRPPSTMPAACTSAVGRPMDAAASTMKCRPDRVVTSATIGRAEPPAAQIWSATRSAGSGS